MIISINDLRETYKNVKLDNYSDAFIERKMKSIEETIRNYTKNHFQNRYIRTSADCLDSVIYGNFKNFNINDTVEISEGINKGLYIVKSVDDIKIVLDRNLYDDKDMTLTKVDYPLDVIECAIMMLDYDLNVKKSNKLNVQSESISRHSVSYNTSSDNINGYPSILMNVLKGYCKWKT